MKFAIIGTGGVGGYFGGKLAKSGEDVWFLARGKHLDAMRANGLHINSFEERWVVPPGKITDTPAEIGVADAVLFCVKSYDTETAASRLSEVLSDSTIIISLQNGVDNEEKIQRKIPRGRVLGGVSYIYSTITAPGVITHTVGPTKIVFGELSKTDEATTLRKREILDAMVKARINATFSSDIQSEIWKKYVFIAAVGGMTALTRLTLGEILAVPAAKEMLSDAMRETDAIGRKRGVNLPVNFVEQIFNILKSYDNNSRSSLYHDLVNGRRMEVEAFSGTIIRLGKELNIPTPVHRAIYAGLLPYHLKHSETTNGLQSATTS
jgi:2-dehydropantoate 2-reductase